MADTIQEPIVLKRRRSIVVDPTMQWPAALAVGGVILGALVLMSIARYLQSGPDVADLSGEGAARLAVIWNAVFLVFVLAAVVTYVLILTHRVAGPARVLEEAIAGMAENDFERRIHLRRRDYLRRLAAGISDLSDKMRRDRDRQRNALDRIERDLKAGDAEAARKSLVSYRLECALADSDAKVTNVVAADCSAAGDPSKTS